MTGTQDFVGEPFLADIQIPASLCGEIIRERVSCYRRTRVLPNQLTPCTFEDRERYRQTVEDCPMGACNRTHGFYNRENGLFDKFLALVHTLEHAKALAFSFGSADGVENRLETSETKLGSSGYPTTKDMPDQFKPPTSKEMCEYALHPLFITLLAFHYGGPINAAFSIHDHERKSPEDTSEDNMTLYREDNEGRIFNGIRITVVWETCKDKTKGSLERHTVFLAGETTPRPLVSLCAQEQDCGDSPVVIIYDSRCACLYYDGEDPGAVRHSISFDFHLKTISNEDLELLSTPPQLRSRPGLSLAELITRFPVMDYVTHFHNLLFDTEVPKATLARLSNIIEMAGKLRHMLLDIPRAVNNTYLIAVYPSFASFREKVAQRARLYLLTTPNAMLFPESSIQETIENARQLIRGFPEELISKRIRHYDSTLTRNPYTYEDLLPTSKIQSLVGALNAGYLKLIGVGFVHESVCLYSMSALAPAFGRAINKPKY
ncbi:hypothetical protein COCC4DRAFT_128002 [Bipolaris maydis ATCC 48331]|uniref:Uncharacterized protein n=2 Tax=Cochliobolus heterostrophus TaxID=5016 RepID=M2TG42_COCH5|nr:uncharacterized protein COCC4DRAFT_128002 [Bipolaris maydis ATCC 48331]EMD85469.1 hypothetical protein COCHEDRAFT_1161272 [Bipolaris maydis C5]KAJ5023751.1 hypothetical protein J3E73DRAFT_393135 [Bipolaris maydis]EMD90419.1 hypothetical protein COCHEDRAFT_1157432 [Bipolaris maydis C5]ENI09369.1 hypothetical protein COCC4DRAFT_128002 [Bipolaris maydis ATCC 48331]KAJ6206331.1 hypothetical protein PSV09DRAFT_1161272 [Bipolaris maydis]